MSGLFTHRVNRYWNKAVVNRSAAVFFLEWMNYINDHLGMTFKGYGTGKVQTGITPPGSWLNWNAAVDPVPWGDNSWFVFEATNADSQLNGGGTMPWQCKLQVTLATGFDDCNVADTDYDLEAKTYIVAGRASVMGGWNAVTLDFAPATGEAASNNYYWFGGATAGLGQDRYFYLDIVGDDDTIVWKGTTFNTTYLDRTRGGYLGMIQRRSASITYPCFYMVGGLADSAHGAGYLAINCKNASSINSNWRMDLAILWPSYSLWKDKSRVISHKHDPWDIYSINWMTPYQETGEEICPAILLAQWEAPVKYAIIGEYRFLVGTASSFAQNEVFGVDPQYQQFCYIPNTNSGVAMRWPTGVIPIW